MSNFDLDDMHELFELPGGAACSANQVWYSLRGAASNSTCCRGSAAAQMPLMAYSPIDQGALARHAGLATRLRSGTASTPAQLALAWVLAQPGVMAIPKSSDPERLSPEPAGRQPAA